MVKKFENFNRTATFKIKGKKYECEYEMDGSEVYLYSVYIDGKEVKEIDSELHSILSEEILDQKRAEADFRRDAARGR